MAVLSSSQGSSARRGVFGIGPRHVDIPPHSDVSIGAGAPDSPSGEAECDPRLVGMSAGDVDAISEAMAALYRTRTQPAIALCIRRQGRVVFNRAIGHARGNGPDDKGTTALVPATPATPFCIFSASKALTAVVMHLLDAQDKLRLGDPVAEYIPEFAKHGKRWITLRHVLTHRAGIPALGQHSDPDLLTKPDEIVALLCDAKPTLPPGRRLAYHAVTGGFIMGEIVRRVTGQSIQEVLAKEITEPLGLNTLAYGIAPERIGEVAHNSFTGWPIPFPISSVIRRALGVPFERACEISNDPRFLTSIVPSGNVVATAADLAKVYDLLLHKGQLGDARVMGRRAVRRMRQESSYLEVDLTLGMPIRYGQGLMLGGRPFSIFGPDTPRAFGHYGFVNIAGWADPDRNTAIALLTSGKPIIAGHLIRFGKLLSTISKHCPKVERP